MQRVTLMGLPAAQVLRLEEALGELIGGFGPFLAVGETRGGLPQPCAARAHLSDGGWADGVRCWIKASRLNEMRSGPTSWINREMQNVVKQGRLHRLLLLLPPGRKPPGSKVAILRQERWHNIVQSLAGTPYGPALQQLDISNNLLVQFRPDGRIMVFRSDY